MHATRERRPGRRGPPAPPLLDPCRYRLRGGPGLTAQPRGGPGQRLIGLALACALEDPGHLGEEIGPAARERLEFSHRGGLLVAGELAPLRPVPRLTRQLRDEDTVSLRTIIGHVFEYRTRL
jgi:hypothetical protein